MTHVTEDLKLRFTQQDRKVLANFTEHLPLNILTKTEKQPFTTATPLPWLAQQMKLYTGAEASVKSLMINCDVKPFIPDGLKIHEHKAGFHLLWDKEKFADPKYLYLSPHQLGGSSVGKNLHKELASKQVMNACVLDWLLANQDHIPESFERKLIFFWGTIYSGSGSGLCVRCLYREGDTWISYYCWLKGLWSEGSPALIAS